MIVEFDPEKDETNRFKHGLSLADYTGFDTEPVVRVDARRDYGETRYRAVGRIGELGFCLVYTETGTGIQAISFRRAHEKEMRRHGL